MDYPNLFEGFDLAIQAEEWISKHQLHEAPANLYVRCHGHHCERSHGNATAEAVVIDPLFGDRYAEHAHDNEIDLVGHVKLLLANEVQAGEAQLAQAEELAISAQSNPAVVSTAEDFISEKEPRMVESLMHDEPPSVQHNSQSDASMIDADVAMVGSEEGRQVHVLPNESAQKP